MKFKPLENEPDVFDGKDEEPKEDIPVEDVEKETNEVFDAGPDLDDMANDTAPEKESEDGHKQTD